MLNCDDAGEDLREKADHGTLCACRCSWGEGSFKYITNTTGGCLSLSDESIIEAEKEYYRGHWEVPELTNEHIEIIIQSIIRDLCINVEFALTILLLKRLNASYIYKQKIARPNEMQSVQRLYRLNLMYISELQEYCFGTVSEQVAAFEKMMPFYLKEDIVATKMGAIDKLLADIDTQRQSNIQKSMDIGGFVMALIFGLPAIYETLSIFRNALDSFVTDIPIVSLENVSISIWLLLIVMVGRNIFKNSQAIKRKEYFKF